MSCLIRAFFPKKKRNSRRAQREDNSIRALIEAQNWPVVKDMLESSLRSRSTCTFSSDQDDAMLGLSINANAAGLADTSEAENSSNKRGHNTASTQNINYNSNNDTLLHCVCRNQPPLEIVQVVHEKYPKLIDIATEKEKHYPVHLACMYGAHPEVISFLVSANPSAASAISVDFEGRTTLHLVCSEYSTHYKVLDNHVLNVNAETREKLGNDRRQLRSQGPSDKLQVRTPLISSGKPLSVRDAMLKSVRVLTRKFPDIVVVNDIEGMTALEHAICGNYHIDVVKSLQRAGERYLRAEKKRQIQAQQLQARCDPAVAIPSSKQGRTALIQVENQGSTLYRHAQENDGGHRSAAPIVHENNATTTITEVKVTQRESIIGQ